MQSYDVIEFEELPYDNIDKYICVPNTWIKWRNEAEGKVIVAYPVEEPSRTQNRVRNYELYSRNWKTYLACAEYATSGYEEAETFIKYLKNKRIRETNELNKKRSRENPSTVPMQNVIHLSQSSHVLDSGANETNLAVTSSDNELFEPTEPSRPAEALTERLTVYTSGKNMFILPREYDPTSPRWTLKYQSGYSGSQVRLIELKPGGKHSDIFINTRRFAYCFGASRDDRSLAKNLMIEMFTKSALKVCTLTGKMAVGKSGDKKTIKRPGLYDHAVNVLVEFALLHGFGDGDDEQSIRKCLSKKLYQFRSR